MRDVLTVEPVRHLIDPYFLAADTAERALGRGGWKLRASLLEGLRSDAAARWVADVLGFVELSPTPSVGVELRAVLTVALRPVRVEVTAPRSGIVPRTVDLAPGWAMMADVTEVGLASERTLTAMFYGGTTTGMQYPRTCRWLT